MSVYRALGVHGISIREKSRAMRLAKSGVDFDEDAAVRLYEAGMGSGDIAHHLRSSKATVLAAIHRRGVCVRSKTEASRRRRDVTQRRLPRPSSMLGIVDRCLACERTDFLEIHHVNADPEDNRPENMVALCWEHHMLVEYLVGKAVSGLRRRGILSTVE